MTTKKIGPETSTISWMQYPRVITITRKLGTAVTQRKIRKTLSARIAE